MQINDSALYNWLLVAVAEATGEEGCERSDQNLALSVGTEVFSLPGHSTYETLLNKIDEYYNVTSSQFSLDEVIEHCLVFAVSEECPGRAEYVKGIMGMESEYQIYLMQIIQTFVSPDRTDDRQVESLVAEDSPLVNKIDLLTPVKTFQSPRKVAASPHETSCNVCIEKNTVITRLKQELRLLESNTSEAMTALKESLSLETNKVVDAELQIIDKDQQLYTSNQLCQSQANKLEKLEEVLSRNAHLEETLSLLQDEIDVLKPQANKVDALSAQIERLRSKLEELNSVKQQLVTESANHTVTYSKLSEIEMEVGELRKLKPQIEDYRSQLSEAMITIEDLTLSVKSKEEEIEKLRQENQILHGGQTDNRLQSQILAEELRETSEALRERERVGGIGDGMSELNPALMQEMNKLRSENKSLTDKLSLTTLEAVENMQRTLEDQKCMTSSLQKKWASTKDSLKSAEQDILILTSRLEAKEADISTLSHEIEECKIMFSEDLGSHVVRFSNRMVHQQKLHRDSLDLAHTGHNAAVRAYNQSLHEVHETLEQTQVRANGLEYELTTVSAQLEEAKLTLEESQLNLQQTMKEHIEELSQLQLKHTAAVEAQIEANEQEKENLRKQHESAIAMEKQQSAALMHQLEEEAIKRRKVERQKKYHELEVQRQKAQLQATGGSGNGSSEEVTAALNELRSMQIQLDATNAELTTMKASAAEMSRDVGDGANTLTDSASKASKASVLRGPAVRPQRVTRSVTAAASVPATSLKSSVTNSPPSHAPPSHSQKQNTMGSISYAGYVEQVEISDRRIDQLVRERREMLSKNLEETKAKNELGQKLLLTEKENATLKSDLRRLTLEKERMERKLAKHLDCSSMGKKSSKADFHHAHKENIVN